MNVLRILCFGAIMYYHILIEAQMAGRLPYDPSLYSNSNVHVASTGVAIFFMLSGMGLMHSFEKSDRIDLRKYYRKRVVRIMIPYWIVSVIFFVVLFKCAVPDWFEPWKIIANVFAQDGYLFTLGAGTFYLGAGEWFMGPLVIMYLIFPLLFYAMRKKPKLTMRVALAIYIIIAFLYDTGHGGMFLTAVHTNLIMKVFDFMVGMYMAMNWKKLQKQHFLMSIIVMLLMVLLPVRLPVPEAFLISANALAIFIFFAWLEPVFNRSQVVYGIFDMCCRYSYEVYLVHHGVITLLLGSDLAGRLFPATGVVIVAQIVLSVVSGIILYYLSYTVNNLTKSVKQLSKRRAS